MLACSVAEAAATVAVALATAVVAVAVIMTVAADVVATVAATAARAMARPATAIIVAAVAVATVAAMVTAAAVAKSRATRPHRPPLPHRLLQLPLLPRLLPSKFGKELNSALFLPVPPLLVLAGGIQRPLTASRLEKRFFCARRWISGRFAFDTRFPKLGKSRTIPVAPPPSGALAMTPPQPQLPVAVPLSDTVRSVLSLIILIHFCCVFTVLASGFRRSPMLERLVSLFAPYTRGMAFDPGTISYYHTLGREQDDDAILLVDLYPDSESPVTGQALLKTITLPAEEPRWLESRHRYLALAKIIQINAPEGEEAGQDRDATAAEVAKAVGRTIIVENQLETGKFPRAVVRCVRRMSQPRLLTALDEGSPPDPTASAYDILLYTADVFIAEDGQTVIVKRAARNQQAPLQPNS
jgi:hypothetical protein